MRFALKHTLSCSAPSVTDPTVSCPTSVVNSKNTSTPSVLDQFENLLVVFNPLFTCWKRVRVLSEGWPLSVEKLLLCSGPRVLRAFSSSFKHWKNFVPLQETPTTTTGCVTPCDNLPVRVSRHGSWCFVYETVDFETFVVCTDKTPSDA